MHTYGLDGNLGLKEVDVFGEIESVLAAVSDHVCIQDIIGATEYTGQVSLIGGAVQRTLQESHQQIDYLHTDNTT